MTPRTFKLLIVEDNPGYAYLVERLLRGIAPDLTIITQPDAQQALLVIPHEQPDVVLLDLMLPNMSGLEFLQRLKGDPRCAGLPVIVLTAFSDDRNIWDAYQTYANTVLVKPATLKELQQVLSALYEFWFGCVLLPQPFITAALTHGPSTLVPPS